MIAVALLMTGIWWAPLLFLVLYNSVHVWLRAERAGAGATDSSGDVVALMARYRFTRLARLFKAVSLAVLGGMLGMLPALAAGVQALARRCPAPHLAVAGLLITLVLVAVLRRGRITGKTHARAGRCLRRPCICRSRLMKKKELLIENKLGLHARAAAQIVKSASAYTSKILLIKDNLEVDGKSIMGIMMLAAAKGSTRAASGAR